MMSQHDTKGVLTLSKARGVLLEVLNADVVLVAKVPRKDHAPGALAVLALSPAAARDLHASGE